MENKTYNTIKQIGRKYLAPTIFAVALALGGQAYAKDNSLPIDKTTKGELDDYYRRIEKEEQEKMSLNEEEYKVLINEARKTFNDSIQDSVFSIEEQQIVYRQYEKALNFIGDKPYICIEKQDKNLYDGLYTNLIDIDLGKSELEKTLNENQLNVTVEPKGTLREFLVLSSPAIFSGFLAAIVAGAKLSRREK
ncbi:MAG: hypothetical protein ACP5OG_00120 [Candidatus Nanoarchaeia archaeon]